MLAVWVEAPWWHLTGSAQVGAFFRSGHAFFTPADPARSQSFNMSTNITWGVVLIHVPLAGPIGILSAQASTSALPRMSGDSPGDPLRLRKLPDGLVRPVRGTPGHMGA